MKINLEDAINSESHAGKILYVCAYQEGKTYSRALQNITATPVLVTKISEYMEKSTAKVIAYYSSNCALVKHDIRKNLTNYNKIIQPYDNTSFKSRKNGAVHIFDDYEECKQFYINLIRPK